MVKKVWKLASEISNEAQQLAAALGLAPLIAQLLINRGVRDETRVGRFLAPSLDQLHDPFLLNDMERAVKRILQAIESEESVLVYGDYDVDGVTASSLMIRVLNRFFPGRLMYYIPKRLKEGYGLHRSSLEKAVNKGIKLVITVDCGISALEEADYLLDQGVDLIITDHHEPQGVLPHAYAVINPKRADSTYPFPELAGVGVAFKLLQGLAKFHPEILEELFNELDLVAFGTVADIVPLLEENRVLVKYGLERLKQTENIGLRALVEVAGLKGREITSGHIGYMLAPRINAAGRMGNSSIGVKLFLTKDPVKALQLAEELEKENLNRQEIESQVLIEAQSQIEEDPAWKEKPALVLAGEDWHLGVIGIVASKLVDLYHKPVILVGMDGAEGRGSGRSISGFNLFNAITDCSEYLTRFGGHEFAAGLSLNREDFPQFKATFLDLASEKLTQDDLQPVLKLESMIDLSQTTLELIKELSLLAPYGSCNPTPVLGCRGVDLLDYRNVGGNGKHLKVKVGEKEVVRDGIGFNLGEISETLDESTPVDLAFTLEENVWNGVATVQLNLKDLRATGEEIKRVS